MPLCRTLLAALAIAWAVPGSLSGASQEALREWPPSPPGILETRLDSGVRVVSVPAPDLTEGWLRVVFGYRTASDAALQGWLESTVAARTIRLLAWLGGGEVSAVGLPERAGLEVVLPESLSGELFPLIATLLDRSPGGDAPEAGRTSPEARDLVVTGLIGPRPSPDRPVGTSAAWIVSSRPLSSEETRSLGRIRPRAGAPAEWEAQPPADAGRDLDLPARPEGGVVIGSRIGGVYYEAWFNTLVVDRALGSILGESVGSSLPLSRTDTVHLLERPVAFPDYPDAARREMLAAIGGLVSGLPAGVSLPEVKQAALGWLGSRPVLEWFASGGLWGPLTDGWSRVWNLTAEDFRALAAAYAREPRMTAIWAPSLGGPAVQVETLGARRPPVETAGSAPVLGASGRVALPSIGALRAAPVAPVTVERLDSGVALAEGSPALFVSGPFEGDVPGGARERGPNGTLWTLEDLNLPLLAEALAEVRADRLLFFAPPGTMDAVRAGLESWAGAADDATDALGAGAVATADLPALVILGTWLERKIIEAGWWGLVEAGIRATEGSRIAVTGDAARTAVVMEWLASAPEAFAAEGAEAEFEALGPAAARAFESRRRDLQVILWQRAPDGIVLPPETVTLTRFRGALGVYY